MNTGFPGMQKAGVQNSCPSLSQSESHTPESSVLSFLPLQLLRQLILSTTWTPSVYRARARHRRKGPGALCPLVGSLHKQVVTGPQIKGFRALSREKWHGTPLPRPRDSEGFQGWWHSSLKDTGSLMGRRRKAEQGHRAQGTNSHRDTASRATGRGSVRQDRECRGETGEAGGCNAFLKAGGLDQDHK